MEWVWISVRPNAELAIDRESSGDFKLDKTIKFKADGGYLTEAVFSTKAIKSGRKYLLDVVCNTDGGSFSLVTRNQNGIRTGDFKSLGQFDLVPDSQVYLDTLTLNAAPFPGLNPHIARSLGLFSVDLQSDDFHANTTQ